MERRLNIGRGHVSQHRPPGVGCAGTALQLGLLDGEKKSVLQSTVDGRQLQPPTQFHRSRVTPFSNEQLASASSDDNVNESDSPNERACSTTRVDGGGSRPQSRPLDAMDACFVYFCRFLWCLTNQAHFKKTTFPFSYSRSNSAVNLFRLRAKERGRRPVEKEERNISRAGHMKLGTLHAAHAAAAAAHRRRVSAASSPAAAEERAGRALFPLGDARTKWEKEVRQ